MAPLDVFLAVNAPYMGITDAANYLGVCGYKMIYDEKGVGKLMQIPKMNVSSPDSGKIATNISVDDIISNCVACGYVKGDQLHLAMPADQTTLTMTSSITTSQANISPQAPNSIQSSTPGTSAGTGKSRHCLKSSFH